MVSRQLLIVEDNIEVRKCLAALFAKWVDYSVTDLGSAREAIQALESKPFDIVISDQNMPHGSGELILEFLIKTDRKIPFVFYSGEQIARPIQFPLIGVFEKPEHKKLINFVINWFRGGPK